MRWFHKSNRKEVWEEEVPNGDLEAARMVRDICRVAAESAEALTRPGNKRAKEEAPRYEDAKRRALEAVAKITDDLIRDTGVREIVSLCMGAHDVKTAQILVGAIQDGNTRQEVLNEHPSLHA